MSEVEKIIEETHRRNRPMPELFTRSDIRNSGGWKVGVARAVRGEPYITVSGRVMKVPLDDSQLAKAIRAHEQVHVKVSPQGIGEYITDILPEDTLRSAEEARVNLIATMLGYPMKAMIAGSEKHEGKLMAQADMWRECVLAVASSVHTGAINPLLSGVRSVAPEWASSLKDISKEIIKFQKDQVRNIKKREYGVRNTSDSIALKTYGSTHQEDDDTIIHGMKYTIELSLLLESIAQMPVPPKDIEEEQESGNGGEAEGEEAEGEEAEGEGQESDDDTDATGEEAVTEDSRKNAIEKGTPAELAEKRKEMDRARIQKQAKELLKNEISPFMKRGQHDTWIPLVLKRQPMSVTLQGAIGRKRVASNIGRNPRRLQRMITDPERRIFDKYVKSRGGIVLIDLSGSMDLSKDQVKEIMYSAKGCTVLGYSASSYRHRDSASNLWILADKGKICDELPDVPGGNGNDLPAVKYAVSLRERMQTPVIWVTDGMVYKPQGNIKYDELECAIYSRQNFVHMEYDPDGAIDYLKGLGKGNTHRPQLIDRWKDLINTEAVGY
jgi:hypothetical protein